MGLQAVKSSTALCPKSTARAMRRKTHDVTRFQNASAAFWDMLKDWTVWLRISNNISAKSPPPHAKLQRTIDPCILWGPCAKFTRCSIQRFFHWGGFSHLCGINWIKENSLFKAKICIFFISYNLFGLLIEKVHKNSRMNWFYIQVSFTLKWCGSARVIPPHRDFCPSASWSLKNHTDTGICVV